MDAYGEATPNTNWWAEGFRAILGMSGRAEADSKVEASDIPGAGRVIRRAVISAINSAGQKLDRSKVLPTLAVDPDYEGFVRRPFIASLTGSSAA
jgi:hypothetical protein